jgi:formylglycine-generating enzyme required for sulfatase activity
MAGKIFISYRRDDDPAAAARVSDGLAGRFGKANLFIDVDDLHAGQRFDEELAKALTACDVLIAVIGERWTELLKAKITGGERDYVREEIAAALQRRIVVIPVRVGREGRLPPLPRSGDLPTDIRDLVLYQKSDITHERFGRDMAELVEAITVVRRLNRAKSAVRQVRWGWIGAIAAGVLTVAYVGVSNFSNSAWWRGSSAGISDPDAGEIAAAEKSRAEQAATAETDRRQAEAAAKRRADEEAAHRDPALSITPASGRSFRDRLANGEPCEQCPEMVVAPPGDFIMGSPPSEPERSYGEAEVPVAITRPFAVGKFAVTFNQWDACVADGGCNRYKPDDQSWGRGNRPVINVNWDDATAYAAWLSRRTGKTYRLLSEAEREYVTRAGTTTPFWRGPSISPNQANYDGRYTYAGGPKGEYRQRTVPVDNFEANPWGLFNVHGNVWEWTEDCWNDSNQGNPGNGTARKAEAPFRDCFRHVVRGGSWFNDPQYLRAAYRYWFPPVVRDYYVGFRLARTLSP